MALTTLIPNIFYADIQVGLQLFVDCLGFTLVHEDLASEHAFCIARRDSVRVHLVQDAEFAAKDRPEIRIETDDIEGIYAEVVARCPQLLHPNGRTITLKPWGVREFALRDQSDVCVILQQ